MSRWALTQRPQAYAALLHPLSGESAQTLLACVIKPSLGDALSTALEHTPSIIMQLWARFQYSDCTEVVDFIELPPCCLCNSAQQFCSVLYCPLCSPAAELKSQASVLPFAGATC